MKHKYDSLWKGMLEDLFEDFLRFVFPRSDDLFDLKRGFEFLDKELTEMYPEPRQGTNTRFVDKLVKVFRKDGAEQWLLVHVEVQGQKDKTFPERMFRYYYRIFDRYRRPVTAIAIFTGLDGKSMPDVYCHEFMGTELRYKYNALYLFDLPDEALAQSDNPFAMVALIAKKAFLTGKIGDVTLLEIKSSILTVLNSKTSYSNKKIKSLLVFLNNLLVFEEEETNRIFEEQIKTITDKKYTMGVIEQLAEIKAEEAREGVVKNLLSKTEFSDEKIAELTNVPVNTVKEIREELAQK